MCIDSTSGSHVWEGGLIISLFMRVCIACDHAIQACASMVDTFDTHLNLLTMTKRLCRCWLPCPGDCRIGVCGAHVFVHCSYAPQEPLVQTGQVCMNAMHIVKCIEIKLDGVVMRGRICLGIQRNSCDRPEHIGVGKAGVKLCKFAKLKSVLCCLP